MLNCGNTEEVTDSRERRCDVINDVPFCFYLQMLTSNEIYVSWPPTISESWQAYWWPVELVPVATVVYYMCHFDGRGFLIGLCIGFGFSRRWKWRSVVDIIAKDMKVGCKIYQVTISLNIVEIVFPKSSNNSSLIRNEMGPNHMAFMEKSDKVLWYNGHNAHKHLISVTKIWIQKTTKE